MKLLRYFALAAWFSFAGAAAATDADTAWAWAVAQSAPGAPDSLTCWALAVATTPPCECGGTSVDCPCNSVQSPCNCGCQDGYPCRCPNCPVQLAEYRKLAEWAKANPGRWVNVYVNCDPPKGEKQSCRYDAGWPGIGQLKVVAAFDEKAGFHEIRRERIGVSAGPPVVYFQIPAPQVCVGGR